MPYDSGEERRRTMQRTIDLTEDQLRGLERLAAEERMSVDELVRLAVGDYLARRGRDWAYWGRRLDDVVARLREGVPADATPEAIEAEITAARAEHRAARASGPPTSAGGGGPGATDAGGR
jgi:Arc/MetJ-type ribon-helix-helix transcriptional regulator